MGKIKTASLPRLSPRQFKDKTESLDGALIYPHAIVVKSSPAEVLKSADDSERLLQTWTISTEAVDRDSDKVSIKGWKLANFKKGGSVLWAHGHDMRAGEVPIAKPIKTWVDGGALKSVAEFTPQDVNPFGYMIYQLAQGGYVRGSSVGFRPLDFEPDPKRDGFMPMNFKSQELLEWSVTPVPSNPEALNEAKSKGLDLDPLVLWIEQVKDGAIYMPADLADQDLEVAYRCVRPAKTTIELPQNNVEEDVDHTADSCYIDKDFVLDKGIDFFVKVLSQISGAEKSGRVLSSSNESKLRQAKELLEKVLLALEPKEPKSVKETEPEPKPEPAPEQDPADNPEPLPEPELQLQEVQETEPEEYLEISLEDLESIRETVDQLAEETLARLNGQVD